MSSFCAGSNGRAPVRQRGERTPVKQRGSTTPKRERPGQAQPEREKSYLEAVLNDASQFPGLPKIASMHQLPRGRKDRQSGNAWGEGEETSRQGRSLSRSRSFTEGSEEAPRTGRARAVSWDGSKDSQDQPTTPRASAPATPRTSILKKPRNSTDQGPPADAESAALAKVNEAKAKTFKEEIMAKMAEWSAFMRKTQGPDGSETMMATELSQILGDDSFEKMVSGMVSADSTVETTTTDSSVMQPRVEEVESPKKSNPPRFEDNTEEVESPTRRPRRNSNPRVNIMEPPSSSSWEYPLSKEEKKARVVMISEMISNDQEAEIDDLEEKVARLSMDKEMTSQD